MNFQSGTVGQPKAVMLTHDNLTWDAFAISERVGDLRPTYDCLVSFLPLSHVAAQVSKAIKITPTTLMSETLMSQTPRNLK